MYKFDGIDIRNYGAMPGKIEGEYLAIKGIFDLPKRIGDIEHNWGTSIEPLLSAEDIQLDGRYLSLVVLINSEKTKDFLAKAIECKILSTDYADFEVVQKDAITVSRYDNIDVVEIKFFQDKYTLQPLSTVATSGQQYSIDGYCLASDFGIFIKSVNSSLDIQKRIDISTTDFYRETRYRELHTMVFSGYMKAQSTQAVYHNMMQFHALCMRPGERVFTDINNTINRVYFKDGIQCKIVMDGLLSFELKMCLING